MEAGVPHVVCCRGRVFDGACKTFTKAGSNQIESNMLGFAAQPLQYSCLNRCDGCLCKLSNLIHGFL